jgi:dephospho-CoA kinase
MIKIGICGIIGSGKSIVSKILEVLGIAVYDSDRQAKLLMNKDKFIIASLKKRFGENIYISSQLNKSMLRELIFLDESNRKTVNSIVHPAVVSDFLLWTKNQSAEIVAIESALLHEANMSTHVDWIINVIADKELLLQRITSRDNTSVSTVEAIIKSQESNYEHNKNADFTIYNNEYDSVILQTLAIIEKIKADGKTR